VLLVGVGVIAACSNGSNTSSNQSFSGTTIRVVTFTGPQIAEPLQRRAPDFEKATGAKVQIITVPFSDLYQKVLTDFSTKTNSYDATVFDPQWMGDYVPPGYLEDLTDRVKNDSALQWNDIAPFFRDFSATFKGKVYTIPLDGDFQMVYYRKDLLQKDGLKAPETWDDYISIAQHFQGKDLNGDGKPDYGSCLAMKRSAQSYWAWISIAAAYLQSQGTKQGDFFNTDTMQPLTNNPAAAAAHTIYKQLSKIGPPEQLNQDVGDSRGLFVTGRCALSLDWGDISPLAVDKTQPSVDVTIGKTGFDPHRSSDFTNMGPWTASGMSDQAAKDYLGAIQSSLQSPNMVLDLRIPQTAFYHQIALDTALAQFLAGEISLSQTMTQITNQWNAKTDEIGRQSQLDAYRSSLSITK